MFGLLMLLSPCLTVPALETPKEALTPSSPVRPDATGEEDPKPHSQDARAGRLITFQSERHGRKKEIYIMRAHGSAQTRLTNNDATDVCPALSPNGAMITFAPDRDGDFEIYSMNRDGVHQRRLTHSPALDLHPAWSPEGTRIAFISARDDSHEVCIMNSDGSRQTRLTENSWDSHHPNWSHDGKTILPDASGTYQLCIINSDGTGLEKITTAPGDYWPSCVGSDNRLLHQQGCCNSESGTRK